MSRRLRIGLVALVAGALMVNGMATLYAAAAAPTIRACVKSSGSQKGLMRYLASGSCASGEKLLTWNVTGPPGPTGPAGPAPSGGADAPSLYSDGWQTGSIAVGTAGSTFTLASLTVPAGTYDTRVSGSVISSGGGSQKNPSWATVSCRLRSLETNYEWYGPDRERRDVALEDIVTLSEPETIAFACTSNGTPLTSRLLILAMPVAVR